MKEKNRQKRLRLLAEAKKKPAVFTVYIILRLVVVAILVSSILRGEYENAAICLLVLFLFLLPLFVQKNFGIELPLRLTTSPPSPSMDRIWALTAISISACTTRWRICSSTLSAR